ncbi:MAG: EamA family transporter [bacterium]|nr:EamA family transporter [bacterium]
MTLAIGLSVLAAFLWAITNILDKTLVSRYFDDVRSLYIPISLTEFVFGVASLSISWAIFEPGHFVLAIVGGGAFVVMGYTYFHAAKIEDISRVAPLFAIVPVSTAILSAIFLREIFSPITYAGIGLIVCGAMLIMFRGSVRMIFQSRALGLMLLSAVVVSFYIVIMKYLLEYYSFWSVFGWLSVFSGLIGTLLFSRHWNILLIQVKTKGAKGPWLAVLSETLSSSAGLISTLASSLWFVTIVSAVSTVQYVFVFVFSLIISRYRPNLFREEISPKIALQKIFAIALIIAGLLVVS